MDMSDMDMSMMGGMDVDMFQTDNMALARAYWYIIAGVLGFLMIVRGLSTLHRWMRLRSLRTSSVRNPTKPTTRYEQAWATGTALVREMSYPQLYVPVRYLHWLTPPPLGRVMLLFSYWAIIIYLMVAGAIVFDAYFWERIGFRNAWVTVTQLPFLYLLASKTSIVGLLSGTSYERLNWLHRWVARTMFVTASVHGWHFWQEWVLADFVELELEMMPMVKWGLAAWGLLLWMVISGLKPFRSMAYEIFVVQHILVAIMFLWVVYTHVPAYAQYNVWFAIAALVFDRVARFGLVLWQNSNHNPTRSRCKGGQLFGHQTQISTVGDSMTVLTIKDVHFKWQAGQHLFLWLPRVGVFESHPYTIATSHQVPDTCICNSIQLVIRAHSGFSKRLYDYAKKLETQDKKRTVTALVAGPYGRPPRWDVFETLVLISASTGCSFTLPILESVLQSRKVVCTSRIDFLLAARQGEEIEFYHSRLHDAIEKASELGIELNVHIAVTGNGQLERFRSNLGRPGSATDSIDEKKSITEVHQTATDVPDSAGCCVAPRKRLSTGSTDGHIFHSATRPDVASFIRTAVEVTGGETGVVVCGGQSLVAETRMSVAKLSDQRAVHKGTGAQGIHLHVEEYCF